jgi:hypothetical protein
MYLEQRKVAPGTINLRPRCCPPPDIRGAEHGLLSPDLAAGIRRVRGLKKLGVRLGNWLTAEQAQNLWQALAMEERSMWAIARFWRYCFMRTVTARISAVGPREPAAEDHWAVVDLEDEPVKCGRFHSQLGEGPVECPADSRVNIGGQNLPAGEQGRQGLGMSDFRKGSVA